MNFIVKIEIPILGRNADEYGCIEWSTTVIPPGETEESLSEIQQKMIEMSKEAPSSQNQEGALILINKCHGLVRDTFRGLPFF